MTRSRLLSACGLGIAAVVVGLPVFANQEPDYSKVQVSTVADLERELERLQARLGIPGMSAAIAVGSRVVWAQEFGWANLERRVRINPETTSFHRASVTKPYRPLDTPGRTPETSTGLHVGRRSPSDCCAFAAVSDSPGGRGPRSPHPLLIAPPSTLISRKVTCGGGGRQLWPAGVFGPMRPEQHLTDLFASAGLVASVADVARFSIALDEGRLLKESTRARAFRPAIKGAGKAPTLDWGGLSRRFEGSPLPDTLVNPPRARR